LACLVSTQKTIAEKDEYRIGVFKLNNLKHRQGIGCLRKSCGDFFS
jgi:hypothetical protein